MSHRKHRGYRTQKVVAEWFAARVKTAHSSGKMVEFKQLRRCWKHLNRSLTQHLVQVGAGYVEAYQKTPRVHFL